MTMPAHRWLFPARATRVVDADTIDTILDLAFGLQLGAPGNNMARLRLKDVWAPELSQPGGVEARNWVEAWVKMTHSDSLEFPLLVETFKSARGEEYRTFGRYVAVVWSVWSGDCLNEVIVSAGMATKERP